MKKLIYIYVVFLFLAVSCSVDSDESISQNQLNTGLFTEKLSFSYQGEFYSSNYYENNEGIIFEDDAVQIIYDKIHSNQYHCLYIDENDNAYYYDSVEEFEKMDSSKIETRQLSQSPEIRVRVTLYKNYDKLFMAWGGVYIEQIIPFCYYPFYTGLVSIPSLKPHGLNDNISAAKIETYRKNMNDSKSMYAHFRLDLYEHKDYTGKSVLVEAGSSIPSTSRIETPGTEYISGLSGTKSMKTYGFNDKATSLKITFKAIPYLNGKPL